MKNFLIYVLILSSIIFYYPNNLQKSDDWPMFIHDPQHTGFSDSMLSKGLEKEFEIKMEITESSPIVFKNNILINSWEGMVMYNLNDGKELWKFTEFIESEGAMSTPLYYEDRVFVGLRKGKIVSLDAKNGTILWIKDVDGFIDSSPINVNGMVIIGTGSNYSTPISPIVPIEELKEILEKMSRMKSRVIALDFENGEIIWEFQAEGEVGSSPGYSNGKIFIIGGEKLYALDAQNGKILWEFHIKSVSYSSPVVSDNKVFIATLDGFVYALDLNSGEEIWKFKINNFIKSSAAVAYDKVFIGSEEGFLYALDIKSGRLIWKSKTNGPILCNPSIADNKIVIGSVDKNIYMFDVKTGDKIWEYETSGEVLHTIIAQEKIFAVVANINQGPPIQYALYIFGKSKNIGYNGIGFLLIFFLLIIYKWIRCKEK